MNENGHVFSCIDCGAGNCDHGDKSYPSFCLSRQFSDEDRKSIKRVYLEDEENLKIMKASAKIEHDFYCKVTRVEETVRWCREIGARKIGIATCVGLLAESRILARILRFHGFEVYGISCKMGEIKKSDIGIPEVCEEIGAHMCNPILQAQRLNEQQTDVNIVMGLCVGHDSLFYKYSKALTTTLVTKDRVLGHNPVAALYQANAYYSEKLFEEF